MFKLNLFINKSQYMKLERQFPQSKLLSKQQFYHQVVFSGGVFPAMFCFFIKLNTVIESKNQLALSLSPYLLPLRGRLLIF